jgi:hypothetical protein
MNFNEVANAVHRLKNGKHEGEGTFSSEFFTHAPDDMFLHLALIIYAMFSHGTAVNGTYTRTITPIPKGSHNVGNSNNYRGIALSSIY